MLCLSLGCTPTGIKSDFVDESQSSEAIPSSSGLGSSSGESSFPENEGLECRPGPDGQDWKKTFTFGQELLGLKNGFMDKEGNLMLLSNAEQGIWLGKVRVNGALISSQTVSSDEQQIKAHRVLPYQDGGWIVAITKQSDKVPSAPGRGKLGFIHQAPGSPAPTVQYIDDQRFLDASVRDMVQAPDGIGFIITGTVNRDPKDGTATPFVLRCDGHGRTVWNSMDLPWMTERGIDQIGAISVDAQHHIHVLGSSTGPVASWIKLDDSGKEIGYKVLSGDVQGAVQASTMDEGRNTLWASGIVERNASRSGRVWKINIDKMEVESTIDVQQVATGYLSRFCPPNP